MPYVHHNRRPQHLITSQRQLPSFHRVTYAHLCICHVHHNKLSIHNNTQISDHIWFRIPISQTNYPKRRRWGEGAGLYGYLAPILWLYGFKIFFLPNSVHLHTTLNLWLYGFKIFSWAHSVHLHTTLKDATALHNPIKFQAPTCPAFLKIPVMRWPDPVINFTR